MTSAFGVVGGEAAARKKALQKKTIIHFSPRPHLPMKTMHHVIPHPGFLRDAGSPEQILHVTIQDL